MRTSIVPKVRRDQRLDLHKLDFGEIDASIELTFGKHAYFRDAFYVPDELDIAQFLSGRRFFVYGLKGTGKTALLRYLSQQIENADRHTRFIVFRHDIAEHERERLERVAGVSVVDDQLESDRIGDFEDAWLYYFHRYLAIELKRNIRWNVLKQDKIFDQYYLLVSSVENPKPNRLASLLEFVKQGHVKSAIDTKVISLEIGADLDFSKHDERHKQKMSLSALVQACNRLLAETTKGNQWLFVFVDEVNVSFGSRKQYKRDCLLIRDLICAIYRINELMAKSDIRIRFVCALRSEILGVSWIAGKEVNKYITGCGVELGWHRRVGFENQPLLRIVEKKIQASEKLLAELCRMIYGTLTLEFNQLRKDHSLSRERYLDGHGILRGISYCCFSVRYGGLRVSNFSTLTYSEGHLETTVRRHGGKRKSHCRLITLWRK